MWKWLGDNYSHAEALTTFALLALSVFAWRQPSVDLTSYSIGVATIFGGNTIRQRFGGGANQQGS